MSVILGGEVEVEPEARGHFFIPHRGGEYTECVYEGQHSRIYKHQHLPHQCFRRSDRERLLAIIEASCGDFKTFNESVRNVFDERHVAPRGQDAAYQDDDFAHFQVL